MRRLFPNIIVVSCLLSRRLLRKAGIPIIILFASGLVVSLLGCGDLEQQVTTLSLSPASSTVGVNQYQLFTALARDNLGEQVSAASITWSVSNSLGSISSDGMFEAGAAAGECTVSAVSEGISDSAVVTITSNGWIAGVVRDSRTNRVEAIEVKVTGTAYGASTDSGGQYTISEVVPGTYEVTTTADLNFYAATPEAVTVSSGETSTVNLTILSRLDLGIDTDPPSEI